MSTIGQLREMLTANQATWEVHSRSAEGDELPQYPTGASEEGLVSAQDVWSLSFPDAVAAESINPYLLARQVALGYMPSSSLKELGVAEELMLLEAPPAGGTPVSVPMPLEEDNSSFFSIASLESLGLTQRETEVLFWIARDKSNVGIARVLGCSEGTVRKHLEHLYEKLGVQTRMGAVMVALERLGMFKGWFVGKSSYTHT